MSVRLSAVARDRQIALMGMLVGPALLIAGMAIGMEPAVIERLVPIERVWVQGAIAVPMLLLAPAALSLAWTAPRVSRTGAWLAAAIAIVIAIGVVGWVATNVSQIGCQPVTDPLQAVPVGAIWGGVAALGFLLSVGAGRRYARDGRHVAAIVAGTGVAVLAIAADVTAFVLLFPPLLCAAPRIPV
jgi:hypothetical protein